MGLQKTKTVTEPKTVSIITQMLELNQWHDNHPLQREADQWTKEERDGFIATVTKNEDFDSIKLCVENGKIWVIDGKQRLTTIKAFRGDKDGNNGFTLGKNIEMPVVEYMDSNGDVKEFDLRGKCFNDFPPELKLQFDSCQVTVVKQLDCTTSETAYHFRRYNHNKALNTSQSSITYAEERAEQIKEIANNRFFLDCGKYTQNEVKKGVIGKIVMESVISTFHLDNWKKQANKMGSYINENVTEDDFDKLNSYFTRLYLHCEDKFKNFFNSKSTFIFVALFDRFTKLGLDDSKFVEFLTALENDLHSKFYDDVSWDKLDSERGTKDTKLVNTKINFLEKLMLDYFDIGKEELEIKSDEEFIADMTEMDVEEVTELMDLCNETLDDLLTGTIVDGNKLLDEENRQSLLALVMYGLNAIKQTTLESWFREYIVENPNYIRNQKQNYLHMRNDLNKFCAVG